MASVKTTNRGVYGQNKVLMDEMLESLADLILEVGRDQAKRPRKLPSGLFDLDDTNKKQYEVISARQVATKKEAEDRVKEHAAAGKKRKRKADRMMNGMGNYDAYEIPIEDFDEAGSYQDEDIASVNDFTDDPDAVKYRDEDDEAAVAEEHFKEKKSNTQPRTKNIRSKAELEKNEDEDFLIKAISAARATSSAVPVVSVDDQLRLQNNLARLELEKIQANHEATLRLVAMCMKTTAGGDSET